MECAFCTSGIDHCHGTLIVHPDGGFAECAEAGCTDLDRIRHGLIIDCQTLDRGCSCVLPAERPAVFQHAS
ncbi:hypothetical protein [Amycolatopsis sp. PS_44_ISF1]|uniref:hypothetical protein n=1 Tax=Amycolatopsis sp. PS_44_ISF1 TaxID=2974917 RepID=UPI0028DF36B3|nr:hypothetical protein [Amycolatopsis sp. PS_44_ISF1]MDT8912479.1 hypothetical protein [Amycolatopsis sp. PS_44_ISF1]